MVCFTGLTGKIRWSDNWVTFMDSMLQAWLFVDDTRSLFVPTEIQKLTINTMQHIAYLQSLDMNAERGEFQLCFFVQNILTSLASLLLQCDVVLLGMWFRMCWTAVPSKHVTPHAQGHIFISQTTNIHKNNCESVKSYIQQLLKLAYFI